MKTLSNNIAVAVQNVLTTAMPQSKTVATEHMIELLEEAITPMLPIANNTLTAKTRLLLPALRGGATFDTFADDVIINIPSFTKATKATIGDIVIPAHSVKFVLPSYDVETVRYFSLAVSGLMIQPDWKDSLGQVHNDSCKLTELIDTVIPVLQGLQAVTTSDSTKVDYNEAIQILGLNAITNFEGLSYDNYTTGLGKTNHGISIIVPMSLVPTIETMLTKDAKKVGVFSYKSALHNFIVVAEAKVENYVVTAVKYRFTVTQA